MDITTAFGPAYASKDYTKALSILNSALDSDAGVHNPQKAPDLEGG